MAVPVMETLVVVVESALQPARPRAKASPKRTYLFFMNMAQVKRSPPQGVGLGPSLRRNKKIGNKTKVPRYRNLPLSACWCTRPKGIFQRKLKQQTVLGKGGRCP